MENNFNNKDFEHFLKQSAEQYRMFPSEKVWNGINNTLHTRRRWYGIGLTLLLLTIGVVTWVMLLSPSSGQKQSLATTTNAESKKIPVSKITEPVLIVAPSRSGSHLPTPVDNINNNLFSAAVNTNPVVPEEDEVEITTLEEPVTLPENPSSSLNIQQSDISTPEKPVFVKQNIPATPSITVVSADLTKVPTVTTTEQTYSASEINADLQTQEIAEEKKNDIAASKKDNNYYPLTIESVVNSYQRISNKKRVSWQIYFLPTISYRKLEENRALLDISQLAISSSPVNYVVAPDVNTAVTHKPDIGLELGFNARYPIAKDVKLTAGLQLNVSKYDIKVYPFPVTEQARIVLNNSNGSTSISSVESNFRNYESFTKPDWLSNFYISASLPVGLEVNLTDARKSTYLGMGGTLQPTYILGDRAYLISTDFKNYAKVPSLTRGWNVSTSFEVFAGYTTGKIKWKVGPQIRYQMLSSFSKKYPVKEHLMDFGLKVGVLLK